MLIKSEENVEYNASNEFKRYYEYPDEFDFEFEENEEFILTLKVRYLGDGIDDTENIQLRFVPYLDEYSAPFL